MLRNSRRPWEFLPLLGSRYARARESPPWSHLDPSSPLSTELKDLKDKAGLVVLYVKEKGGAEQQQSSDDSIKLLLCGDQWPAQAKLTQNKLVKATKDQTLGDLSKNISTALGLSSLDGYELCKGKGKPPAVTPGGAFDLSKKIEKMNLPAVALVYVRKKVTPLAAAPPTPKAVKYEVGAPVDVVDQDGVWEPGTVKQCRDDGTYDVTMANGKVEQYVDEEDLRPGKAPPKPAASGGSSTMQKTLLVKLKEQQEALGLDFHAIGGVVFIDECKAGLAFARAGVPKGTVLVSMNNAAVKNKADIARELEAVRKKGSLEFPIVVDESPAAKLFVGAPVEVDIDRELLSGVVVKVHGNGYFDVQVDDEVEPEIPAEDIRLKEDEIKVVPEGAARGSASACACPAPKPVPVEATPLPGKPDHEGLMKKQGADLIGLYKTRWFALYGSKLVYCKVDNKKKPMGTIDVEGCVVTADERKGKEFMAISGKKISRTYNLVCPTEEEKDEWLMKLSLAGCQTKRIADDSDVDSDSDSD
eukprot:Sspe_Gene.32937::Locus_16126_Transcript_1_1_Confidence_1.000_Length_1835::g.32937::m.32937